MLTRWRKHSFGSYVLLQIYTLTISISNFVQGRGDHPQYLYAQARQSMHKFTTTLQEYKYIRRKNNTARLCDCGKKTAEATNVNQ